MEGVEVKGTGGRSTGSSGNGRCVEVEGGEKRWRTQERRKRQMKVF